MLKRSRANTSPIRVKQIASKSALMDGQNNRSKGGNVQQIYDKYISLAREAITTGDRVLAESYYQHAEHYLRLLNEQRAANISTQFEEDLSEEGKFVDESGDTPIALQAHA